MVAAGIAAVLVASGVALASGGGSSSTNAAAAGAGALPDGCRAATLPAVRAVAAIDSRLDIGLNQAEYSRQVGDGKVKLDQVRMEGGDRIDRSCETQVLAPLDDAIDHYATASETWSACISSTDCESGESQTTNQTEWASASASIARAQKALAGNTATERELQARDEDRRTTDALDRAAQSLEFCMESAGLKDVCEDDVDEPGVTAEGIYGSLGEFTLSATSRSGNAFKVERGEGLTGPSTEKTCSSVVSNAGCLDGDVW